MKSMMSSTPIADPMVRNTEDLRTGWLVDRNQEGKADTGVAAWGKV
jgi:hypothetical protein